MALGIRAAQAMQQSVSSKVSRRFTTTSAASQYRSRVNMLGQQHAGMTGVPTLRLSMGGWGGSGGSRGGSVRTASGGSGGEGGSSGSKGLWGTYLELLESSPMLTRSATCAILNGIGDIISQIFLEEQELDWKRLGTFTGLGLVFVGPTLTTWYGVLARWVTAPGLQGVITSVAIDQLLFAPVFIGAFMAVLTTTEGKPQNVVPKLKQDLPDAIKVNWALWVPAQFINFQFVPPNLRVLAVNIVALVWNCYMSYQSHKAVVQPAVAIPAPAAVTKKGRK